MNDDTISRQAAIDTLNIDAELLRRVLDCADIVGAERAKYEWGLELIESNISDMKELPSAEPERKTGEWIITSEFKDCRYVKCNQCKVTQVLHYNEPLTNYCPACGAKMDGGGDDG